MRAELVRGQNHPLDRARLVIRVSAGTPVVAAATLGDADGKVHDEAWVAHPGTPVLPGLEVPRRADADHRLTVDLDAVPDAVHRVSVLLALPAGDGSGPARFGAVAAPFLAVTGLDGTEIAGYAVTGLDAEAAVVALEFYRRQGVWKVRAVGQGYAGGLAELLTDQGLPQAHRLAAGIAEAAAGGPGRGAPAPASRPADGDRSRPATAPALGPDHGAATLRGAPEPVPAVPHVPHPAHGAPPPGTPGQPASPSGPGAADRSAVTPPSAPAGGPVDYSHPRRHSAAPPPPPPAAPGQPARPVAGDAPGWSLEERLYNQVWGMFEDLARATAAYRGAVDFADARRERELDQILADPRSRISGQGDAAREAAEVRHVELVDRAREAFDRDLAQLTAEAEVVEPALPPAFARWDSPVWHAYRVPGEMPMALRLGDLHLPEADRLRIPMLVRLPLERGLWIDSGAAGPADGGFTDTHELRRRALESGVAHAARLLAAHPAGEFTVHVVDPAGSGAPALAPLVRAGVLADPPALGAAGVAEVLARLTQRVDLVQMAVRGGAGDSLPRGFDTSQRLLIVHDFPHGFDDRAVNQLRYLADEGPAVGVHLMVVADREESAGYGPLLDPLWRSLLRLTPVADDHLADPWVGHAWTYEPPLPPPGSQVLQQVLTRVAAARRTGLR
ncbi:TerD family protein [Streptomyces sp. NPDC052020]|uniref:TerD family protein n=1 Tax=Streptomyces sp. NPDC052020 TaxID=3155677 RepID=UPI0034470F3F